ncbi:Alpha/Beta hydrolase protein [Hypoxylon trugodes]|uniref:Alpha/Beta hydrolase protein n=1 Tax=Hypoxylon trugodes TaxID=326681 RepID=UPI00219B1629|nr:Alpha/Beta hydrolase protein [Hypoxylon trugodes]KAI1390865.1 Alpha/Beta hydrolase protein [Hypoxylon trugodes]
MAETHELSGLQKAKLWIKLPFVGIPVFLYLAVRNTFIVFKRGITPVFPWAITALSRTLMTVFTPLELQFLAPDPLSLYTSWIKTTRREAAISEDTFLLSRIKAEVDTLIDEQNPTEGISLFWVGDRRKAQKIVLYLPGGGYVVPPMHGHFFAALNAFLVPGSKVGVEVAVAILPYSLAPARRYPAQLRQATLALKRFLDYGFQPSDIILAGDSAGGGLAASLIFHLTKPNPSIPSIELSQPLAATLLFGPWLSDRVDYASFRENQNIDEISPDIINRFADEWLLKSLEYSENPKLHKSYAFPMSDNEDAPTQLPFGLLARTMKNLVVIVGANEVLRDQGVEFVNIVKSHNPGMKIKLTVAENEGHVFCMADAERGIIGEPLKRVRDQFVEALVS